MKKILSSYYSIIIQAIVLFSGTYIIACCSYNHFGYYARRIIPQFLPGLSLNSELYVPSIIIMIIVFPIFLYSIWNSHIPDAFRIVNSGLATFLFIFISLMLFFMAGQKFNMFFTIVIAPMFMFFFGVLWLFIIIAHIKSIASKYVIIQKTEYSRIIEEQLKSERFKTELITNVSHDIKTPLTSIINYVDLIKRLDNKDRTLTEYVDILDKKSTRLKMLINDLIEASKAGTGNIQVELQELDLVELTGQVAGEFDSTFKNAGLEFVFKHPEERVPVKADGRHLWRIMENIFMNAAKYSMPGTRVYADINISENSVDFSLKNVSKEKLGISADELMEQFVRGDRSRHSEGSGLGLYIARSLTALMGGKLEIKVIGDLFEVVIQVNK